MRKRLENKQGTYTNIADQLHVTDTDIRSHFDSHSNYVLAWCMVKSRTYVHTYIVGAAVPYLAIAAVGAVYFV